MPGASVFTQPLPPPSHNAQSLLQGPLFICATPPGLLSLHPSLCRVGVSGRQLCGFPRTKVGALVDSRGAVEPWSMASHHRLSSLQEPPGATEPPLINHPGYRPHVPSGPGPTGDPLTDGQSVANSANQYFTFIMVSFIFLLPSFAYDHCSY